MIKRIEQFLNPGFFGFVKVNEEDCIAVNENAVIFIPRSDLKNIEDLPARFMVAASDWPRLCEPFDKGYFKDGAILLYRANFMASRIAVYSYSQSPGIEYLAKGVKPAPVISIPINAEQIAIIMAITGEKTFNFKFSGDQNLIEITPYKPGNDFRVLIMPMKKGGDK